MIQETTTFTGALLPDADGRLSITVAEEGTRFSLRLRPEGPGASSRVLGLDLPAEIGAMATASGLAVACLGPDEWYMMADASKADVIPARIAEDLRQQPHSLVDVSHREVGIDLRGPAASLALASFCAFDLDAMAAPSAARTILDRSPNVLIKHAPDHFCIEVWPSFASHVWGALACARAEMALDI